MNNSLTISWQWLSEDLRRLGVLISLLFSAWIIFTNDTLNTDGILYLDVAYHIAHWDWAAASKIYHWNFYSALIALVSKIMFLEVEAAAVLINSLFFAGIAWMFLSILKILGASRQVLIAGLVIISIHPYINEYRADILRGPGFWFCMLWALRLLIKLQETGKYVYGIILSLAFIIATLFRIEGIVFLLFAPMTLLFSNGNTLTIRLKLFVSAYIIPLIGSLFLIAAWLIIGDSFSVGRLTHPVELLGDAYQALVHKIPEKGEILATQVLNPKSDDFGVVGVVATLAAILLLTTIKRITLFILILAIYAKLKIQVKHMPVLLWLSLLNITYMALYITHYFFLSSRFAMPVALYVALPASFALAKVFQSTENPDWLSKLIKTISILFIAFMLLDGLISTGASKRYLRESGYWLEENMKSGETLLTNQLVVNHYANKRMTAYDRGIVMNLDKQLSNRTLAEESMRAADYVAIRTKHLDANTIKYIGEALGQQPVKQFSASEKEKIIIYHNKR